MLSSTQSTLGLGDGETGTRVRIIGVCLLAMKSGINPLVGTSRKACDHT